MRYLEDYCERRRSSGNLGTYVEDIALCSDKNLSIDVEDDKDRRYLR